MKLFYKLVIFFAIFHFSIVIINSLNVFPNTLYSDIEVQDLRDAEGPEAIVTLLFPLPDIPGLNQLEEGMTLAILFTIFFGVGSAVAVATHSWTPIVTAVLITSFIPMVLNSYSFFSKMFLNWDVPSITYLSIAIGVGILLVAIITVIETPTHGRSGS